ncbi:MAG TPA: Sec-independent protein translocase protein TatB [Steroidobacteraceae bacterium]|jgi:Tat protein translocase TatB subunit
MFEVGFTEIILILGIALLVLGPEKLPKLANQVGRWAGRARAMARQLRQQLDEEVTVISKEDLSPSGKRPPVAPAVVTPPPAIPEPPSAAPAPPTAPAADEPGETRPS